MYVLCIPTQFLNFLFKNLHGQITHAHIYWMRLQVIDIIFKFQKNILVHISSWDFCSPFFFNHCTHEIQILRLGLLKIE